MRTDRVDFLDLRFDRLTFRQVKGRLRTVTAATPYGYIVTPNVDHMVRLHREPGLRELYEGADLCLCDSRILRLLARISGIKLPLVAGSDLCAALFRDVIKPADRIAVIGSTLDFMDRLRAKFPGVDFVHHCPPMGLRTNAKALRDAAKFLASANARFSFVTAGSPQQEVIASDARPLPGAGGMTLCVGAGLEFLTGEQVRAPRVLQRLGLEWTHRLATNPRRLWRRYLVEGPRIVPIYVRWCARGRGKYWLAAGCAVIAFAVLALAVRALNDTVTEHQSRAEDARRASNISQPLPPNLPPPNLLRPLSPDQAAKENATRPFVDRPDTPASRFVLRTDADDRERALTCLAQVVYYEAAGEGVDGGRAVAQVVLNRMHHPGFPASVCGVVYQGSDRPSGCQFTFTCDGSLLRAPVASLWARSRKIAEDALAGHVFVPVGHATHYHAEYVLPYWADSLDKTVQIGRHIFYRLRSVFGDSRSFFQHYAGSEPPVSKPGAALVLPPTEQTEQLANALISNGLNGTAKDGEKVAQPAPPPLAADLASGTLIGDPQQPPAAKPRRAQASSDCAAAGDRKQLTPLGSNDVRAGEQSPGC